MRFLSVSLCLVFSTAMPALASAHCQVPCGIYDDHGRVHQMLESVTTIAKATAQIITHSRGKTALDTNQAFRWINTKESHANEIQRVVSDYFLIQKIKPADKADKAAWAVYVQTLADHHAVLRLAMKAKQTVDPRVVAKLRTAVSHLGDVYWKKKKTKLK